METPHVGGFQVQNPETSHLGLFVMTQWAELIEYNQLLSFNSINWFLTSITCDSLLQNLTFRCLLVFFSPILFVIYSGAIPAYYSVIPINPSVQLNVLFYEFLKIPITYVSTIYDRTNYYELQNVLVPIKHTVLQK